MFSSRTNWNTSPNKLTRLLEEKRRRNETIIDLTESNPTQCKFRYPSSGIVQALSTREVLTYQPDPKGTLDARRAVVEYYQSIGITIEPSQIILTSSTSEAYSFIFRLLCNKREQILAPQPSYPLFEYLCRLNDVSRASYHLAYDGEWSIDIDSVRRRLSPQTRAIILVHPNNPTGSFLKKEESKQLLELASKNDCALIVDEVFHPYAFFENDRRSTSFAGNSSVLTFTLNGISKLLGLPQLKLSWMVVSGPDPQKQDALHRLEIIADTYLSVNTPVQMALPQLLSNSESLRDQILKRVKSNYRILEQELLRPTGVSLFRVEGGWYSILQLPRNQSDEEWALEFLNTCNVLVHPGHFFEISQASCIVFSLLPGAAVIRSGVRRILSTLRSSSSQLPK